MIHGFRWLTCKPVSTTTHRNTYLFFFRRCGPCASVVFLGSLRFFMAFIASSFVERSNMGMALGFPEQSSSGRHAIEKTTDFSSFARASQITLRYSVSSDETSNIHLFWRAPCNLVFFFVPSCYLLLCVSSTVRAGN